MRGNLDGFIGFVSGARGKRTARARDVLLGVASMLWILAGCVPDASMDLKPGMTRAALLGENGIRMNGLSSNGIVLNGIVLNGITLNGIVLNGIVLNGIVLNGIVLNGVRLTDLALNGVVLNGLALNDLVVDDIHLNGVALDDMELTRVTVRGAPLTSEVRGAFKRALGHMAACALPDGQCITVYDVDGAALSYCGVDGLDSGWATNSPDLSRAGDMAVCVSNRAQVAGDVVEHRPVNLDAFKMVLRYMVQCALPEGDSVVIYDENDAPVTYYGALGLAPEWRDSALEDVGQRRVSACLAARTNALAQPVQISLRGAGMTVDGVEQSLYRTHEAAFWGNLFADQPYVRACVVDGGGLSGRVCSESESCGFELMGACEARCSAQDAGDGAFSGCAGESEVVNVFLNLGEQRGAASMHDCVAAGGAAACRGVNDMGQLGLGYSSPVEDIRQPVLGLDADIVEVGVSLDSSCARKRDGTVWCWGENSRGQLGDGSTAGHSAPVQVAGLGSDVASLGIGAEHGCAHMTNGTLWCWGSNQYGAVGDGTGSDRLAPVKVTALGGDVARVSSGAWAQTTCAVRNSGALQCWGRNDLGQVGDGTQVNRLAPVEVATDAAGAAFAGVTEVCSGAGHTCARKADGTVWCWGQRAFNAIGDGQEAQGIAAAPVQVSLTSEVVAGGLACGARHTCAVAVDGTAWCWGDNTTGALGDGTVSERAVPVQVSGLVGAVDAVMAGEDHSCAIGADGSVQCWGGAYSSTL